MADEMVKKTQQWLNRTYEGDVRYIPISENGLTGWATIYALRRALQIELGINATSNNFGPTTTSLFNSTYPNGVQQQNPDDESESNVYAIIQGALWCKGYSTGSSEITKHFYSGTGSGVKKMKEDAGCSDLSSTVTLNVMKALLSMDQFKKVSSGNSTIRTIQQSLNRAYENYIGLAPCDGLYGREMNKALIQVLQAIEGLTPEQATGTFGPTTKAKLPLLPNDGSLSSNTEKQAVLLARYALYCNGYTSVNINSDQWDGNLRGAIVDFQGDMALKDTYSLDVNTWMSLLVSTGNPDRPCMACDTAYGIRGARINDLIKNNILIVGRYITGGPLKELDFEEEKTIIDNGLQLFPIYQKNGTPSLSHFTELIGINDVALAYRGARNHCIPKNTIIYYAVDMDVQDSEIESNILPYFKGIKESSSYYKIGVYGTRNVCSKVMAKGYAETCFVSDMSTGYSGNMGFKMPKNWNFDQYATTSFTNADGTWYIDKVGYSTKFEAVSSLSERYLYEGDVTFTGSNTGRQLLYGGKKLRAYVTITDENNKPIEGVSVLVKILPDQTISDPVYDSVMAVHAYADGTVYDFTDTILEGNIHYEKDFMRILKGVRYYSEATVYKDGKIDANQKVKMYLTIETSDD